MAMSGRPAMWGRLARGLRGGRRLPGPLAVAALVAAFVVALPLAGNRSQLFFWETVAVQVLFATSVNLLFGYANMASFGQAAFYGLGAYATAELARAGLPVMLVLPVATLAAAIAGLLVGAVATRASGVAFSMVTLAVGQGLYLVAFQSGLVGGENGIPGVLPQGWTATAFWYLVVASTAVGLAAYHVVVHSPFGQTLVAIREDPKRAAFLGVDVRRLRIAAFVWAASGAGLAGSLMAYSSGTVTPDYLYWTQSGYPVIMALVGGMRVFWGPALGAFLITWLLRVLGQATPAYLFFVGLVLLAVLVFAPEGLLPLLGRLRRPRTTVEGGALP